MSASCLMRISQMVSSGRVEPTSAIFEVRFVKVAEYRYALGRNRLANIVSEDWQISCVYRLLMIPAKRVWESNL